MIPKECKRLAEDRPDSYWLNVVTNCVSTAEPAGADQGPGQLPLALGRQVSALLAGRERHDATDGGAGEGDGLRQRGPVVRNPAFTKMTKQAEVQDYPIYES